MTINTQGHDYLGAKISETSDISGCSMWQMKIIKNKHMKKTIFHISKMDCPSEENLIRMKLDGLSEIKQLDFDIANRKLTIYHDADNPEIENRLNELNLGAQRIDTIISEESELTEQKSQTKLLWAVLFINFAFFVIEMISGIISGSMGLLADSLDMLADSFVYGLSLWAVGAVVSRKKLVARLSGYFQIILAGLGLMEVVRRFVYSETAPSFKAMIIVSFFALMANAASMFILQKTKSNEAHIKASKIFTSNDIIINIGIIIAGILVMFSNSLIPDLIIGTIVFVIVLQGALRILKLGR
ncbi:MAG: cation transporter [Bacteroidales bacterium]|nr:cation transporter [Bacteroidales bacterium]